MLHGMGREQRMGLQGEQALLGEGQGSQAPASTGGSHHCHHFGAPQEAKIQSHTTHL